MRQVMRVGKGVAALGFRATQAILNAIYRVVALICRLFGLRPPATPQLPLPDATPASVRERVQDSFEHAMKRDVEPVADLGHAVHQYAAAAEPWVRSAVDLTTLSPEQFAWLMGLSDGDLQKLATSSPAACQRAVTGKRCGIVGLPVPGPLPEPEPVAVDPAELVREAFRDRLRRDGRKLVTTA